MFDARSPSIIGSNDNTPDKNRMAYADKLFEKNLTTPREKRRMNSNGKQINFCNENIKPSIA